MKEGGASKENLPKRKYKRVRGCKTLHEDLESLGFTPSLAKPKMGKEIGR